MSSDLTNILTAMILSAGNFVHFLLVNVQTDPLWKRIFCSVLSCPLVSGYLWLRCNITGSSICNLKCKSLLGPFVGLT
jgi:hypothetical protein